jgi:alpha-D-xyloside xylohydrolase
MYIGTHASSIRPLKTNYFWMKQTNYQLVDFLDFNPNFNGEESLWKVGRPTHIETDGADVVVALPFQRQKCAIAIEADAFAPRNYKLRLRAYGEKILRVGAAFEGESMPQSPMLEIDASLSVMALRVEKKETEWLVKDANGTVRARFNLAPHPIEHWSDLLPEPQDSLEATFYPDGEKAIEISAYDQFFPARHDAFAFAFVDGLRGINRTTMSFKAQPNEVFVGTGERFTKMDLTGRTVQLKNQDGQGVNNRRTYKNIPFYLSSSMYGVFMHTSAYGKISLADHSSRSVQLLVEEPAIDLFLFGGETIEEILYGYRQLLVFQPCRHYGVMVPG